MTVTIKNVANGAGWGEYVVGKNDNRPGATVILGDAELGDAICKTIDYKAGNSVNFVISFAQEDGVTQEQGRTIAKEFMQSFMDGFNDDEYHLDLVEHTDTDNLHYHARVPKVNLLTNTQLKLYWHKTDLEYKKAVIDDICYRHGLVTGAEMKNTIPNPMHKLNQINKWREEHSQEPLDLSSPKLKRVTEKRVSEYISETVRAGLINSLDDVKAELVSLGLEIVNEGYDRGKKFHYLTVQNDSGKMRIRGDIYGEQFYNLTREDRAERVRDNRSFTTRDAELKASGTDVKQALQRERRKRLKFIEKQYGNARKRAYQREDEASIKTDRNQEQRDIGRLGTQNGEHTRENVMGSQEDAGRGRESFKVAERNIGTNETEKRERDAEVGGSEQGERQLHHTLDNNILSMDSSRLIGFDISQPKPTDTKERERRDNDGAGEREIKKRVHNREDGRWRIFSSPEERRQLNDRIRAEINDSIRATARSVYCRIETDNNIISREHERSQERDREAVTDVEALRRRVHELADKHQSRTARRIGEEAEREDAELDGAVEQSSREQSAISKSYAGLERELDGAVGRVGEKAGGIRGAIKRLGEFIVEVIEKAKKIVINKDLSQSRVSSLGQQR